MKPLSTTISTLAFTVCLITCGTTLAADTSTGVITFRDKDENSCSVNVPPIGSGLRWQYEFRGNSTPCTDNTAITFAISDVPSAAQIFFGDEAACSKQLSDNNQFWFELKTIKKLTNTEILQLTYLDTFNKGSIVRPGLQLVDKGRLNQDGHIREKLSCVRITVSSSEQTPEPAPIVILANNAWSEAQNEETSDFSCEGDQILIGRKHTGDENGPTQYHCGTANPTEPFKLTQREENTVDSEKDSYFLCPPNKVITGRKHTGDEEEPTTYRCAAITDAQGQPINPVTQEWSESQKESASTLRCGENTVMVGRLHEEDENGKTQIRCASLTRMAAPSGS